jgi:NTE family protein
MGLEPIWKDHEVVLVSDAGGLFDFQADKDLFWRIRRYQSVQEMQCRALRRRWLIENLDRKILEGTYWSVGSARASYVLKGDAPDSIGYSKAMARERIATIRTDLDAFSDAEVAVLENHGYLLADKAISRWCPALATTAAPLEPPHPAWLPPGKSEVEIQNALASSHKRKVPFGRR